MLLFNVHEVEVMRDEEVLEICYTTVPVANNATMCTLKFFKTIDFMLCVLTTKNRNKIKHKKTQQQNKEQQTLECVGCPLLSW